MAKRTTRARRSRPSTRKARSSKARAKTTRAKRAIARRAAARSARRAGRTDAKAGGRAGRRPARRPASLDRERRALSPEERLPSPPSSLDLDRHPSAARSGQAELKEHLREHTEASPALTGGDVDADWAAAYSVGDEAPGGDNPTPDQDVVDEIGRALGVEYQDAEELRGADKITKRDEHRWEFDPASSEDYKDRVKK